MNILGFLAALEEVKSSRGGVHLFSSLLVRGEVAVQLPRLRIPQSSPRC